MGNRITRSKISNQNLAATLYTLEMWIVLGILRYITCIKVTIIDDDDDDDNNNNNNKEIDIL
jgi:hypothetical protein